MSYKYSIPQRERRGEVYTIEELYREYHGVFVKLLLIRGKSDADAWDICHNVFELLIVKYDTIIWDTVEQLMSSMLYNEVVDYYKKFDKKDFQTGGSALVELIDEKLLHDPVADFTKREFRITLQRALETCSKMEKEMFFGFYLEDKTVNELRQGKSKGRVVTPLARARAKVAYYFDKHYEKD